MTENDARGWLAERFGDGAVDILSKYVDILTHESSVQNLISSTTLPSVWSRHIVDSAQLATLAPSYGARWCDIGSGAGLPGLVVAMLIPGEISLVEPRRKRAEFLKAAANRLGLSHVRVCQAKIENADIGGAPDIITARAVASLSTIFELTRSISDPSTRFILPKGRTGADELASAKADWQGVFHVERSVSDAESIIVIADGVTRRCSASR